MEVHLQQCNDDSEEENQTSETKKSTCELSLKKALTMLDGNVYGTERPG